MRVSAISWKGISALLSFKKTADKLLISASSVELGKAAESRSVECCTGSLTFNTYCCRQGFRLKLRGKFPLLSQHFPSGKLTSQLQEISLEAKDEAISDKDNSSHGFPQRNSGIFTLNSTLKILSSDKLQTWDSLSTTEVVIEVVLKPRATSSITMNG